MSLKTILIDKSYSSDSDDVLTSFYIPVLQTSVEYKRLAGFFSSTSLAIAARGIVGLIRNGGTMKLVMSPRLSNDDLQAIVKSSEEPQAYIARQMVEELEHLEDEFVRDHVFALGWMLANKKLVIKTALVYDDHGRLLGHQDIEQGGLFHQKVGILIDSEGNRISFSGSINETAAGWLENVEEFKVFRNWEPSERAYVDTDDRKFDRFWSDQSPRVKVIDIPRAVEKRLIEIAPATIDQIDLERWYRKSRRTPIQLFQHQRSAVDKWVSSGMRGIFEMATGTGKTFAALACLERAARAGVRITIIACPYQHLVQQWRREIEKFGITYDRLIIADSSNPRWRHSLTDAALNVDLGHIRKVLVLTTHDTVSSESFVHIVRDKHEFRILLIADEVHGLGAQESRKGLIEEYDYRLGLSATPKRWFDLVGTNIIDAYFGGTVYEFTLYDAINTINPATGRTYLVPYRYVPVFVSLKDEELSEYANLTRSIVARYNRVATGEERDNLLERLLFKRADVIKNAAAKYEALEGILDQLGPGLQWTIVYCSPQQIEEVVKIIGRRRIVVHRFTMHEGTTPNRRYGGVSQREYLLEKFAEGKYQALAAMRCLDEGVDVPPARTAILLASSGNPREYIQRIGRVIRRSPDKGEATIYDIVVVPQADMMSPDLRKIEAKILGSEWKRYEEIAKVAVNSAEALAAIFDVKNLLWR